MKRIYRSLLSISLVLILIGAVLPVPAEAADVTYQVSGYTVKLENARKKLSKDNPAADITVYLTRTAGTVGIQSVARAADSFDGGKVAVIQGAEDSDPVTCTEKFTISGLKYTGVGQELKFTVFYTDGSTQDFTLTVRECYTIADQRADDSSDDYVDVSVCPEPRAVFSVSPLSEPLAAGQKTEVTITVINLGTVTMKSPILTITPTDGLMLTGGESAFVLKDISAQKSVTVTVPLQALSSISEQSQGLDCSLSFAYNNNSSSVIGSSSGKLTIPALASESESTATKPVPRIILADYDYGGSVEAGKKQAVSFTFKNTSKSTAIENILLTVSGGGDLTISGSTNTFYFESLEAGGSRGVSVPFKAASVLNSTAQDVRLSFEFEYAESGIRKSGSADLTISVPLFQPDRFTLAEPKVANIGFVGDQNTVTLDYVNKGKNYIYNLEAYISGDVDTSTPSVRVGNVEAGKSGTIAFAVAPYNEGANPVIITVSYEDSNGETKEQIFEASVEAMAFEPYDPGEWEEPIEEPTSSFPWWIIGIVCAIATIVIGVVISKKKKKAKLAAEAAMWDDWDDDKSAAPAEEKKEPAAAAVEEKKE